MSSCTLKSMAAPDKKQSTNNKRLIAIMESNGEHWRELGAALTSYYDIIIQQNASVESFETLHIRQPALIIAGPEIKPKNSIDAVQKIRKQEPHIPILFIAENAEDEKIKDAEAAGVAGILAKPYMRSDLIAKITEILNTNVEKEWEILPAPQRSALQNSSSIFSAISDVLITGATIDFEDIKDNCSSLVDVVESGDFKDILDGVKMHDDYTYAHSMRVATLLTMLGHAAGFSKNDQLIMSSGGLLHDVGKMKIPHEILNKPGRLTEEEFEQMKSHVPETVDYLKSSGGIPKGVMIIAEQHHEKIDGTGYPYGLKGAELNELARMSAVVDVFSALTDRRVYKEPMESNKAMTIMKEEMIGHLDQHFVKLFEAVLRDTGVL
ncbi:MAG: HD domain-containing phosphohydrolase [Alphaproteobacteria bacterium]